MADPVTKTPRLKEGTRAYRTSIALKLLMAISGIVFVGFVLGHMYGNLKAFSGHDAFNEYAHHLRELGEPLLPHEGFLWIMRAGLIVSLVVHVVCAVVLWRRAQKARPVRYAVKKHTGAIPASRLMRFGGLTIFLFLVWHLVNFTIGKVNVQGGETDDPYNLLVDTFDVWWMTLIYLAAMAMLGAHLHHGVWSSLQTLGWTSTQQARATAKTFSLALAIVIAGGFSLVPLAVLAGIID
ncbi:succinate dehydrogenase / fumarate reductase cytochrome b subunit [Nocardioides thalensis]|uniref:Succinate dehydrogenase / fumarate reductase cytochrome b subunit n=1 Tax=Nocardioides thalensis TaxID=1914755 RepID=A0A853C8M9_9ACTN|nr:succinate dehydrogenase / fumarate reductase cytochrome b subunit [Nocardioides thalensis]